MLKHKPQKSMAIHAGDIPASASLEGLKNRAGVMACAPFLQAFLVDMIIVASVGGGT